VLGYFHAPGWKPVLLAFTAMAFTVNVVLFWSTSLSIPPPFSPTFVCDRCLSLLPHDSSWLSFQDSTAKGAVFTYELVADSGSSWMSKASTSFSDAVVNTWIRRLGMNKREEVTSSSLRRFYFRDDPYSSVSSIQY